MLASPPCSAVLRHTAAATTSPGTVLTRDSGGVGRGDPSLGEAQSSTESSPDLSPSSPPVLGSLSGAAPAEVLPVSPLGLIHLP